jgi:hypothetical protein
MLAGRQEIGLGLEVMVRRAGGHFSSARDLADREVFWVDVVEER